MSEKIKVLIADDHPLVTEGIALCLEAYDQISIVGTAHNGIEALSKTKQLSPDVVMLDINMPEMNGLEAVGEFRKAFPDVKVLMLSMHDNREYVVNAIRNGARGYILKDVPSAEVAKAIEAVHQGGLYFSSGLQNALLEFGEESKTGKLTAREENVLAKLATGQSNKVIAGELEISIRTVETHRKNIKRKLGISSTAGLTRFAMDNGLI